MKISVVRKRYIVPPPPSQKNAILAQCCRGQITGVPHGTDKSYLGRSSWPQPSETIACLDFLPPSCTWLASTSPTSQPSTVRCP